MFRRVSLPAFPSFASTVLGSVGDGAGGFANGGEVDGLGVGATGCRCGVAGFVVGFLGTGATPSGGSPIARAYNVSAE